MKHFHENVWIACGLILIVLVGVADYLTGTEIAFSIFYLLPVSLVSWYVSLRAGTVFAVICTVLWFMNERLGGHNYSNPLFAYWNAAMRGIIFLMAALLLSKLKQSLGRERTLTKVATMASSAKSDFLAHMSHEIRTPLNAVIGTTSLLFESELSHEQREYVQILNREGNRLLRLINDILDLSKVEAGQFEVEHVPFDLRRLVEEIVSLMGIRIHEKGLEFSFRIKPDVPRLLVGDPDCIRRIIINLVGNAIKFTEDGLVTLLVETNPHDPEPGHLLFSVSDTGTGIPEEKLDMIFERFVQADSLITRKYGGTGLGLSISKKMVEILGGVIWAESTIGKGSTFYFSIPFEIADSSVSVPVAEGESKKNHQPVHNHRALRVLLAEDYETSRRIIHAFLKKTSYLIDDAENGKVALEKFKIGTYDIVLMDMQMPVIDGYEAIMAIRKWEQEKKLRPVPVIALTAHAYKEDIHKSIKAGCNAHVTKPIDKEILFDTIFRLASYGQIPEPVDSKPETGKRVVVSPELREMIPLFLDEMHSFCRSMEEALDSEDFASIQGLSHKIKGAGGSYGFQYISRLGESIENAAVRKEKNDIRNRLGELIQYLDKVEVSYGERE